MFLRLFVLLVTFFYSLYGAEDTFSLCVEKARDSHSFVHDGVSIPLKNKQRLLYSLTTPKAKIIKQDRFLSLYLIEDAHPFAYPFAIGGIGGKKTALITQKHAEPGVIVKRQLGLNHLARFSKKTSFPALLTNSCCALEGIATYRGVIEKSYLRHFLQTKEMEYGDIGIRLEEQNTQSVVSAVDPFFKENPFKYGDIIVSFDNKKVHSASRLMQTILFAQQGSWHTVKVKRDNKLLSLRVCTSKRYGGGVLSDTFLERFGIFFDKKLTIVKITNKFKNYGLAVGDRLLGVNGVLVKAQSELRKYLQKDKSSFSLLFERKNFEFFVNIK